MAFNIKMAEENFFNSLPGNVTDAFLREDFSANQSRFEELSQHFGFSLTNSQKIYLNACGIQLAPIANKTHPHALSKTVENHIIFNILPNLIKDFKKVVFFSIKESKADYIWRKIDADINGQVINRCIDAKDSYRYKPDTIINCGSGNFEKFCHILEAKIGCKAKIKPDCIFLHDELHYWKKEEMHSFLAATQPKNILATVVYPPEILKGFSQSMNSEAYSFKVRDDQLFFWPDGSPGKPYQQPKDCWILQTDSITFDHNKESFFYSVSVIESVGAHHLISIQRGKLSTEKIRFFSNFDCIDLSKLNLPIQNRSSDNLASLRVRSWVFRKICSYLICLKKGDVESALAKLRQLSDSEPMPDEIVLINDFFSLFLEFKLQSKKKGLSFKSIAQRAFDVVSKKTTILQHLVPFGQETIQDIIRKFIQLSEPMQLEVNCHGLKFKDLHAETSSCLETVNNTLQRAMTKISNMLSGSEDRKSEPYNGNRLSTSFLMTINQNSSEENFYLELQITDVFDEVSALKKERFFKRVKEISSPIEPFRICYPESSVGDVFEVDQESSNDENSEPDSEMPELEDCSDCEPDSREVKDLVESKFEEIQEIDEGHACIEKAKTEVIDAAERFLIKDMNLSKVSERKNSCFFKAVAGTIGVDQEYLIQKILKDQSKELLGLREQILLDNPIGTPLLEKACEFLRLRVHIYYANSIIKLNDSDDLRVVSIGGTRGHLFQIKEKEVLIEKENLSSGEISTSGTLVMNAYSSIFGLGREAPICINSINVDRIVLLIDAFESMNFGAKIDRRKVHDGLIIDYKYIKALREAKSRGIKEIMIHNINCYPFVGFAGSGKTFSLVESLIDGHNVDDFVFVASRRKVIDQIQSKIDSRQYNDGEKISKRRLFTTFENALLNSQNASALIFDECSLNPNGMIDLMLLKHILGPFSAEKMKRLSRGDLSDQRRMIDTIAVTGDTLQNGFFSENCSKLNKCGNDLKYILKKSKEGKVPYLLGTRRFGKPKEMPNFFDLGFYADHETRIISVRGIESMKDMIGEDHEKWGVITTSRADKDSLELSFENIQTINEVQGSTFDAVALIITRDFFANSIESLIVSVTRHRKFLAICVPESLIPSMQSIAGRKIEHMNLIAKDFSLLNKFIVENLNPFNVITEQPHGHDFEEKLEGDPFLKSELSLINNEDNPKVEVEEIELTENLKTHIPISFKEIVQIEVSEMRPRECREFKKERLGWSNQFKDEPNNRDLVKMNSSMLPEAIFPRHSANDDLTFWAAVKKRLVFQNPLRNALDFEVAKPHGKEMLKLFLKHVPIDSRFDSRMYEKCIMEFEEKKISKPASMIGAHHPRSTTDWPINEIFLFIKSQLCTKQEKMFCDAKAGQTLACFSHMILCKFAPLSRYIEKKVSAALPDEFYIHQKKNFDSLESWVKSYDFDKICTESDYEAFDASQDSYTLAFEVELMNYMGVSKSLIADYIFLKMNLNCKLGNLAIMRFTGEFCTFLFNTLTNMLFTFMKYKIKKGTAICFAGDDMCANARLNECDDYINLLKHFKLKAKVSYTRIPTFCGWRLSRYGIVKAPKLIAYRIAVAEQKQQIDLVIDSYFLEHLYAYKKGDNLFEILNQDDLEHHYNLTRFFIKNKYKMHGTSRLELEKTTKLEGGLFGECFGGVNPQETKFTSVGSMKGKFWGLMHEEFINHRNPVNTTEGNQIARNFFTKVTSCNKEGVMSDYNREVRKFILSPNALLPSKAHELSSFKATGSKVLGSLGCLFLENTKKEANSKVSKGVDTSIEPSEKGFEIKDRLKLRSIKDQVEERCPLYLSRVSGLLSKMIQRGRSLMPCNLGRFMEMQMSSTGKCLTQLRDFSLQLKYQLQMNVVRLMQTSMCWILTRLNSLNPRRMSTHLSILVRFSYQSLHFTLNQGPYVVLSTILMGGIYGLRMLPKLGLASLSLISNLTLRTFQTILCPLMTKIWTGLPESKLILRTLQSCLAPMHLSLTLESCTDSPLLLSWMTLSRNLLESDTRQFLEQHLCLIASKMYPLKTYAVSPMCKLLTMVRSIDKRSVVSSLQRHLEHAFTNIGYQTLNISLLGQLHRGLIRIQDLLIFQEGLLHLQNLGNQERISLIVQGITSRQGSLR
ncbi:putative replication-associated protein (RP) [Loquat virus A]|uniref:Putative replication-associated protein (RP) n=1 Tax=Loquat virus A TaxID=2683823 RepID=A0A6B9CFQ1_9VIRU|nr:putative replication-associated protein (RP) [Loquat virus A]QGW49048.1 putative replication-associated protein (RP) [Loquat virus A]